MKLLFINLDNTLIKTKSGKKFPLHSKDWIFIPETIEALKYYLRYNYRIIIVSNQEGIELGFLNEQVFVSKIEDICNKLEKVLKLKKNSISYRYCKDTESYNKKPNPGMAYDVLVEEELSLKHSIMIGESVIDEAFSDNVGIKTYYHISDIISNTWK